MAKQPTMIDINTLIQAGIDPKTGLPLKFGNLDCALKGDIKKTLRVLDEQDAIHRYTWYNLPSGLDGELIERVLYYRGQGMLFYMETNNKFYFLPYTLSSDDGTGIDVYGRFVDVTPIPFNGSTDDGKKKPKAWIQGLNFHVVYDLDTEIPSAEEMKSSCVLLTDYCKQISQTNISRQILQDPILDAMAESFPMARTSLMSNSGARGVRVADQDQAQQVTLANLSLRNAAVSGQPLVPIVANLDMQELTGGQALKSEEFLIYLQALDNYRLSLYGLKNGGLFQKKSHMLESEQEMNMGTTSLVYQDGLYQRQKFCDLVNYVWGLGIWCEPSEAAMGTDRNMDGDVIDDNNEHINSEVEVEEESEE